jgi:hypothetical protein
VVTPCHFLIFSITPFLVTSFFAFLLSSIVPLQDSFRDLFRLRHRDVEPATHALAFLSAIVWFGQLLISVNRFKVMDDERLSDDLAAWACFRLDRLQPGLRLLHLYDSNGVLTNGVILVRIKKTVSRV